MPDKTKASEQTSGDNSIRRVADPIGQVLTDGFHVAGLFAIAVATAWAGIAAVIGIFQKGHPTVEDLLLLFIYLEIGSMVGIYFRTNHMPLRFVVYIGITAVTRHLIGYVNHEPKPDAWLLILSGAILLLALAVLVIRYASAKYGTSAGYQSDVMLADSESEAKEKS